MSSSVTWDRCSSMHMQDTTSNKMDTPHGHRYELWASCDLHPERTWTSDLFRLFVDKEVSVTLLVDPEIASVYVLVPSCMGSTLKISPDTHPEVDALRARICISVIDDGMVSPDHVEALFLGLASAHSTGKLSDIALVALASFPDPSPVLSGIDVDAEHDSIQYLTGC